MRLDPNCYFTLVRLQVFLKLPKSGWRLTTGVFSIRFCDKLLPARLIRIPFRSFTETVAEVTEVAEVAEFRLMEFVAAMAFAEAGERCRLPSGAFAAPWCAREMEPKAASRPGESFRGCCVCWVTGSSTRATEAEAKAASRPGEIARGCCVCFGHGWG